MTGPLSVFASATAQVAVTAGSAARGVASTTVGQVAALGVGVYAITHIGDVLMVVGGVAATAVAVSAGAAAVQQHRGAWRPLGPGLVSTATRMVEGHSCARCQTARLVSVPAVAVVMSASGDIAGVCAAHFDAVRLGAATREIPRRNR